MEDWFEDTETRINNSVMLDDWHVWSCGIGLASLHSGCDVS